MRREAHFRESPKVDGQLDDEFVYAILADEWRRVAKGKAVC
jgi:RimJ/RimL family protein N-acetyltransferase